MPFAPRTFPKWAQNGTFSAISASSRRTIVVRSYVKLNIGAHSYRWLLPFSLPMCEAETDVRKAP